MIPDKHNIPNHRCKGSLDARTSIRYHEMFGPGTEKGWYLHKQLYSDFCWDVVGMSLAILDPIFYCPFCGVELNALLPEKK